MNHFFRIIFIAIIFFIANNCFAMAQDERLWFAINSQQTLSNNKKWLSFIFSQLRFINQAHPWQMVLLEGGMGYRLQDAETIWLGYRWTGRNPYNGFIQENRLFQQFIQQKNLTNVDKIIFRTRLEEIEHGNSSQIAIRLRERVALELMREYFLKLFPFLYDEIFMQLKSTNYTSNKFVNENRLFLGFNLYASEQTWWEIGYINQFQLRTPQAAQNTMSHIASFTYNFS